MKKTITRIITLVLTLAIALSMATTAFATEIEDAATTVEVDDDATAMEDLYPALGREVTEVPLFNQKDYPDAPYGIYGSVSTHGCGITCLAMVATYLHDRFYAPDVLAEQFGSYNTEHGSEWRLFEDSAEELGLDLEKRTYSWDEVEAALANGQVVISLQSGGIFTDGGHFIVLTGMNENGRITVNDPYGGNYQNGNLQYGFANGFTASQVRSNGGPYWIYAPKMTYVPVYNQCDYAGIPYAGGDVKSSGCSITSMAMVASYMLGREILPDELASEYNIRGLGNDQKMEAAAAGLGLEWTKAYEWKDIVSELEAGKVCIALMKEESEFTDEGHFIVLAGITEDGEILVNDPWGPNYQNIEGFDDGILPQWLVQKGMSGVWVFDKYPETVVDDAA